MFPTEQVIDPEYDHAKTHGWMLLVTGWSWTMTKLKLQIYDTWSWASGQPKSISQRLWWRTQCSVRSVTVSLVKEWLIIIPFPVEKLISNCSSSDWKDGCCMSIHDRMLCINTWQDVVYQYMTGCCVSVHNGQHSGWPSGSAVIFSLKGQVQG